MIRLIISIVTIIPVITFAGEIASDDLELVPDSSVAPTVAADSGVEKHKLPDSIQTEKLKPARQELLPVNQPDGKLRPYIEASFGNIWLRYKEIRNFWKPTIRLEGYGFSGGIVCSVNETVRMRAGIRFHKMGNKVNFDGYYYDPIYDLIQFIPVDSVKRQIDGYFKQNQYYLSIPISADIFLKRLPVYVLGGCELGYLLSASSVEKEIVDGIAYPENFYDRDKNLYRPLDFSLHAGSGVRLAVSSLFDLDVQLVYSAGLFIINNPDDWWTDFKTREISLRAIISLR